MHRHGLSNQAIEIVAMELCTDGPATFEGGNAMDVVGYEMTKTCADLVFKQAGYAEGQGRHLVGVVELHDCFAANEVCNVPILCPDIQKFPFPAHYISRFGTLRSTRSP